MPTKRSIAIAAAVATAAAGLLAMPVSALESSGHSPRPDPIEFPAVIDTVDGVTLSSWERRHYETQTTASPNNASDAPAMWAAAGIAGEVTVEYVDNAPTEVREVMNAAIENWVDSVELSPTAPLVITVEWLDLHNPGILGLAGSGGYYPGEVFGVGGLIPAALANTLAGYDFHDDGEEIYIKFNSGFPDWHLDPTTLPSVDEIDLYSVALHEIGHGMGFAGSARDDCGGCADLHTSVLAFDHQVLYDDQPVVQAIEESNANFVLTSNSLSFNLGNDRRYKIYAPAPFENGASYSHFDEVTYHTGAAGALMSPDVSRGEVERKLEAPVLGVLARIGWPMAVEPATPEINWINPGVPGQIELGWSEDLYQKATPAHYYNVAAYRAGSLDASVDVAWNDFTTTLTGIAPGSDYEIVVTPVGEDSYGVPAKINTRSANDPSDPVAPTVPGTPSIIAQDSGRNATIAWSASEDNVGVTKYRVYSAADETPMKTVTVTNARLSLDIGEHQVYVRAVDAAGNVSGQSDLVTVVVTSDPIQEMANQDGFTSEHANVMRLYWAFFNRDPDPDGGEYWIGISDAGHSLDVVAENFAVSQEFQDTYGATTDEEFLRIVYYNVLGRSADLSGYYYWLGQMQSGLSRGGVVRWIAANNEFAVQHPYPEG